MRILLTPLALGRIKLVREAFTALRDEEEENFRQRNYVVHGGHQQGLYASA